MMVLSYKLAAFMISFNLSLRRVMTLTLSTLCFKLLCAVDFRVRLANNKMGVGEFHVTWYVFPTQFDGAIFYHFYFNASNSND